MQNFKSQHNSEMSFIVDNCVVSKFHGNGIKITPISLLEKKGIDISKKNYQVVKTGSRVQDNRILQKLSDGILSY